MNDDATAALREQLRADPPAGVIETLDDAQLSALAETVRDARRRQSRALAEAGDAALSHLPGLARRAVQRVIR